MNRFSPMFLARGPAHQRGIALFVGLVFLIVLSLVAVIAMQSTLLEMRMVTNVARHAEAFQTSEAGRAVLTGPPATSLFAQSMVHGGWPASWGGDVPDADFDLTGLNPTQVGNFKTALIAAQGSPPKLLFGTFDIPGAGGFPAETTDNPASWVTDAVLKFTDPNGTGPDLTASLAVVPDGVGPNPGAGAAQAAGYRGLGVGVAGGGASRFFQIRSVGTAPASGRAVTIAQFKAIVQ